MKELALLDDIDNYRILFTSVDFWGPAVKMVCRQHGLTSDGLVRIGVPGTCPTFITAERWVIKFFGRLFEGAKSFAVEREAGRLAALDPAIPAAQVVAQGELGGEGWPWPYLVYAFIPGISLGELAGQVMEEDWLRIARELGEIVRRLHALPLETSAVFPNHTRSYLEFLRAQRAACLANHRRWGSLPAHLIEQIEDFLPPLDTLIDHSRPAHMIHADLTRDHLLGQVINGRWTTLGLIDFGDAMTGDLLYELAALHIDLFRGRKQLLSAFLDAYGVDASARAGLAHRAMATALLHEFDLFSEVAKETLQTPSLEALAEVLWGRSL